MSPNKNSKHRRRKHKSSESKEILSLDERFFQSNQFKITIPQKTQSLLNTARKGKSVMQYNKLISLFAKQRRLDLAFVVYRELRSLSFTPTIYTFTNLLNACVRCGDILQAEEILNEMKIFNVKPNSITYTVYLKGLVQDGQIPKACNVLDDMYQNKNLLPNLRTYNTILRGCMQCGYIDNALSVFQKMSIHNVHPDIYSYEYIIKSLCHFFRLNEVLHYMKEIENRNNNGIIPTSAMYSDIAMLYAFLRHYDTSLHYIHKSSSLKNMKKQYKGKSTDSLDMFLSLRQKELTKSNDELLKYIKHQINLSNTSQDQYSDKSNSEAIISTKISQVNPFLNSNRVFILDNINNSIFNSNISIDTQKKSKRLSFRKIFKNSNSIRLEIGSGRGEWITNKASSNQIKNTCGEYDDIDGEYDNNWVSIELRFELCFQIWMKMRFQSVNNMAIICGNAHNVFHDYIKSRKITEIFVNFPEKPAWEGTKRQLFNLDFLNDIYRTLVNGGIITILTDDYSYCKLLTRIFLEVPQLFKSLLSEKSNFTTNIPEEYGSSYFDRFWNNSQHNDRYFLQYVKQNEQKI